MQLTVLVDNHTLIDRYFEGEAGLSFYIEDQDLRLLFDLGYSDLFLRNARRMNIEFNRLDYLVFSHSHGDHTGGLESLIKHTMDAENTEARPLPPTLVGHPDIFVSRCKDDIREIGSFISREKAGRHFTLELTREPLWLSERLVYLGEIPRSNDFESLRPLGKIIRPDGVEDDFICDDSALAYVTREGLVIITGCSHAGICNIVTHARKICGRTRIVDIIGGFHLLDPPRRQLQGTLDFIEGLDVPKIHACHCTDLKSKIALAGVVPLGEVGVGFRRQYD